MTARPRGFGSVFQRGRVWWIRYDGHGGPRESSKSTNKTDAEALLKRRMHEAGGRPVAAPSTYEDLEARLVTDLTANKRTSLENAKIRLRYLRAHFRGKKAADIGYDAIAGYIAERLKVAKPATVDHERKLLRRMFRLSRRADVNAPVPEFPTVEVDNARQGFAEPEQVERLIPHLPRHAQGPVRVMALTGARLSAVLGLTWAEVDWKSQELRFRGGTANKRRPRAFPFGPLSALVDVLQERRALTTEIEHERGCIIPWVFHRGGKPLGSIRTAWRTATKAAGMPGLLPHDLKRSAVRNLIRAGVPERVAMDLTGHRTRAMHDRYNVSSPSDLAENTARLAAYLDASVTIKARTQRRG